MDKDIRDYVRKEYDKVASKKLSSLRSMARELGSIKGYSIMTAHDLRNAIMRRINPHWKYYVGLENEIEI